MGKLGASPSNEKDRGKDLWGLVAGDDVFTVEGDMCGIGELGEWAS